MDAISAVDSRSGRQTSWLPLIVIAMAQILMSFNVNALPVSIGGIVASFETSPTTVGTAIVTYSLFVAAFVMLGAKIGARMGSRQVFQLMVGLFGVAMALMAFSSSAGMMILAQGVAGAAAAALVPTLVVLIAASYQGREQAQALGWLGAAEALGGVLAFLVAGSLGTWLGWRYPFGLLVLLAVGVFILSRQLEPVDARRDVKIDAVGVVLAALAIILISVGFDSVNSWGLLLATDTAPFDIGGLSPAPVMIAIGILIGQTFFVWSRSRERKQKTPLIASGVIGTPQQRSVVYLMFVIVLLGAAISFLIPLYIQIVQGRTSLQTALAIMPYSLSIFAAAILVLRLYDRLTGRQIARGAFLLMAAGLILLTAVIRNEWNTVTVVIGLIVIGAGLGALVSVLFNTLAAASPRELAGDVGSLRGTANNLAGAVGTAVAGALLIGILSATIMTQLVGNATIPVELKAQVDLDNITFVSNDRLKQVLERTTATPEQVDEAVRINTEARLRSLKISFLALTGLALLAILPAGGLPGGPTNRAMRREDAVTKNA